MLLLAICSLVIGALGGFYFQALILLPIMLVGIVGIVGTSLTLGTGFEPMTGLTAVFFISVSAGYLAGSYRRVAKKDPHF
jgi:hypothetical protein